MHRVPLGGTCARVTLRSMTELTQQGLEALGLDPLLARVLAEVLRREQTTAAEVAAALGCDRSTVSSALGRLVSLGLVDRVRGRRPVLVFVHEDVVGAARRLVDASRRALAEERQVTDAREAALDDAAAELLGPGGVLAEAAERRRQRARPALELATAQPWERYRSVEQWGRTSHDEVLPASLPGRSVVLRCPARLLVVPGSVDPRELTGLRAGAEVRRSDQPLPELRVLDRTRVGVLASGPEGLGWRWSRDLRHVRAAEQLFTWWWETAEPCLVVPQPVWKEPGFDEWEDLDDLPDEPDDAWPGEEPSGQTESRTTASSGSAASGGVTNL